MFVYELYVGEKLVTVYDKWRQARWGKKTYTANLKWKAFVNPELFSLEYMPKVKLKWKRGAKV